MEIKKRLTSNYKGKSNINKLLSVVEQESELLKHQANRLGDQFVVNRSSEGLSDWEKLVGITPLPDQPMQSRRRAVQERIAGFGVLTKDKLDDLMNSLDEDITYTINPEEFLITFSIPQSSVVNRNVYWTVEDFEIGDTLVQVEGYPRVQLDRFFEMARLLVAAHITMEFDVAYTRSSIGISEGLIVESRVYQKAGNFKFGEPLAYDKERVVF